MNKRAFTLIEVLTVISIIGILVSITSYVYASSLIRSRDQERLTELDTIKGSLEQYYMDHRSYPNRDASIKDGTGDPSLVASVLLEKTLSPNYLATIPTDPAYSGDKYSYLYLPLAEINKTNKVGYYLAAKVERKQNASDATPNADINSSDHGNGYLTQYNDLYWFGDKPNFGQSSFTHYYYLKNTN
jgi:prepilin-type N-terminal cleavage/methylation domain-containing protein